MELSLSLKPRELGVGWDGTGGISLNLMLKDLELMFEGKRWMSQLQQEE